MSQPKNRRRAARRLAKARRAESVYIHVLRAGEARNPIGRRANPNMLIAVGFGTATVERDGRTILDGDYPHTAKERRLFCDRDGWVRLRKVEKYIERRRLWRHRWQVVINAPLWSATWERRGPERWVCVKAGEGFA